MLFGVPLGLDGGALVVKFGQFLPDFFYLLGVVLALDGLALNLQLTDGTLHVLKFFRYRVDLQPQTRGGLSQGHFAQPFHKRIPWEDLPLPQRPPSLRSTYTHMPDCCR